jgi:glycosyltransferase involved in cell wall biosynthesis
VSAADRGLRIALDGRSLGPAATGAGQALGCLLAELREQAPQHCYSLIAPRTPAGWRLPRQLFWEQVEFPWRAALGGARIVHAPGGTSAPVLRRGRVVMTLHDVAPSRHPEWLPSARSRWYWGHWVPRTARLADAVLVPSLATRRDLIELIGVEARRIHVVPLACALDVEPPPEMREIAAVRHRLGLPERYLLYVGTIDRRKDLPTLLAALREIDTAVALAVAGTVIRGRTDFSGRVERLGLGSRVRLLGYVPAAELRALYRGASMLVYPSFYEGFGLPVLEAMASGTPVVTYRLTSLPEVAGDAAVLLDPPVSPAMLAAAITRVLEDPAVRVELVGRGLEQAKRFSWRTAARLTLDVYEALA